MRYMAIVAGLLVWGCGSPNPDQTFPAKHRSVTDNLAESERHEREAAAHEARRGAEPPSGDTGDIQCIDDPLAGVTYIGTEPYKVMRPCWTGGESSSEQHRKEAERHREAAAASRARAAALVAAEGRSCGGLGEAEISRSPLTHADDVVRVDEWRDGDTLVGARMVLRRVRGLTPEWLRSSLVCHQSRAAALGYPVDFMSDCPNTLPNTSVEVEDVRDGIEVRIRANDDLTAAAILGRATDILSARGAE